MIALTTAGISIVAVLLVLSSVGLGMTRPTTSGTSDLALFSRHISHIIFLMQENRAYDNLFGTYCQAVSANCPMAADGLPTGTCVPLYPGTANVACHSTYAFSRAQLSTSDLAHDWNSSQIAFAQGRMNGFYLAEGRSNMTFGHYDGSTVPVYWDLAEEYGLADNFFSSAMTYSLANHWFMLGSSTPADSVTLFPPWASSTVRHQYLDQANETVTVENQLVSSSVSWKYYDFALENYHRAINNGGCCGGGGAYDFWNPLAARYQSYTPTVAPHFVDRSQFFSDAATGSLPEISWIMPSDWQSDHAPSNLSAGQDWTASVVNALEGSPDWGSSVLFIAWDEYGGWYDHVAPPRLDSLGDGFRVPFLAIGPWVAQGVVDHEAMDFGSVLALMEQRFGIACTGARDCNATLPLGLFDFSGGPRAPITIPYYGTAVYPMPLQSSTPLGFNPAQAVPPPSSPPPNPPGFIDQNPD